MYKHAQNKRKLHKYREDVDLYNNLRYNLQKTWKEVHIYENKGFY